MERYPPAARAVERAAISAAWSVMADPLRIAARDHGYALALHGSMARDLDLIAIPWREHCVDDPEALVATMVGVLRGLFGRSNPMVGWEDKPHGRRAKTILVWGGWTIHIDLSVMPQARSEQSDTIPQGGDEQKQAEGAKATEPNTFTNPKGQA